VSWDAIGAVAELIGAAGVVASLVYLSIQIRANTRTTRASASFEALHSWANLNEAMGLAPDAILEQGQRWSDPATRTSDLSPVEYHRLSLVYRAVFQKLEGQYYLHEYGLLEPAIWRQRSRTARGIIDTPLMREWWENEQRIATFSEAFVAAVEAAEPVDGTRINRAPSDGEPGV
jgi:4-alpha-glucanotransferase